MLVFFSSDPFYNNHVKLPHEGIPVPLEILNNPKFHPFFDNALGTIDSTHFNCCPSAAEQQALQDHKGAITQNCLAICTFDMKFIYVFSGWEGSTSDLTVFHDAHVTDLPIPPGKYYLADSGFLLC